MENYEVDWTSKKVFIKLKSLDRFYSGRVLRQSSSAITILDKMNHLVTISFDEIAFMQEEKW